uniref:HDC07446 n=1 Tax=Drosophila melanogaster TaxID=7227 RepID=Q6IM55_DROME|nr:TPA_inf: HDC07446 [Drosophila melanogaster]
MQKPNPQPWGVGDLENWEPVDPGDEAITTSHVCERNPCHMLWPQAIANMCPDSVDLHLWGMWTGTLPVTWTIRAATSPAFNLGFHPSSSSRMRAAISPPCWLSFLSAFFILCCVAFRDRKTPATQETRQPSNPNKPARF